MIPLVTSTNGARSPAEGAASFAAMMLMVKNPKFGKPVGDVDPHFVAAQNGEPAMALGGIAFDGTTSVSDILAMMRAVTERLTPQPDPDPAHPTIKLELWWVQDVHEHRDGLELPSPLILDELWANEVLGATASRRGPAPPRSAPRLDTRAAKVPCVLALPLLRADEQGLHVPAAIEGQTDGHAVSSRVPSASCVSTRRPRRQR